MTDTIYKAETVHLIDGAVYVVSDEFGTLDDARTSASDPISPDTSTESRIYKDSILIEVYREGKRS